MDSAIWVSEDGSLSESGFAIFLLVLCRSSAISCECCQFSRSNSSWRALIVALEFPLPPMSLMVSSIMPQKYSVNWKQNMRTLLIHSISSLSVTSMAAKFDTA